MAVGIFKTLNLPADERLSIANWRSLLIAGIALGAIYALIALGYTLVYGILRMINFAHGEVFMVGRVRLLLLAARVHATAASWTAHPSIADHHPVRRRASTTSAAIAVLLERVAYRPLRNAPRLVPLITAIGASLFLQNSFQGLLRPAERAATPRPKAIDGSVTIFGASSSRRSSWS